MFKNKRKKFCLKISMLISAAIITIFYISAQNIFASSVIVGATNPWPGNENTNVSSKNMRLIWSENVSQYNPGCAPVSSYDVYLSLISDPAKSPLFSTDNLKENFIDVGDLEYNQIYYWRVDIHDACGNVSQSPVWYFITGGPAIPPRPENLNIQLLQNSDIKLIWSGGYIDGGGYDVERKEENGSYKFISSVAIPEFFLGTNLSAGVKYYYRVKAHNISGSSDYSNEESIIIPLANTQVTNPILKIEPSTIVNGSRITFTGEVQNAIPGSDIKFYLQRPDGSMKENGTIVGKTDNNGNLRLTATQEILSGKAGIYKGWIMANGRMSNIINFTLHADDQISEINNKANLLKENKLDLILAELNLLRDIVKEQKNEIKYLKSLTKDLKADALKLKDAINNFITYGVDDNTKKLGEGERAAVIHSYKAAFNKFPETEEELADTIKIANGRWPSMTNEEAEKAAKKQFEKIYKHIVDMDNPHDNAAITVMAYGLRQKAENRNLLSEQQGIKIFKGIYGHNPSSTEDWNMMQAITYSGASRGKDSDGDLLIDEREAQLKTDPKNPDTDGDGYKDGEEVANGYDPLKK